MVLLLSTFLASVKSLLNFLLTEGRVILRHGNKQAQSHLSRLFSCSPGLETGNQPYPVNKSCRPVTRDRLIFQPLDVKAEGKIFMNGKTGVGLGNL